MALRSGFIVAYLSFRIGVPLGYDARDNPFDERFAWRMFSPVRVSECRVELWEQLGPTRSRVDPSHDLAPAWVGLMARARLDVIERYAEQRCAGLRARVPRPELRVELQCPRPGGGTYRPFDSGRDLCGEAP